MGAFDGKTGAQLQRASVTAAWLLAALFAVGILYLVSSLRYIGEGVTPSNTIAVSGTGKVYAIPDTGEFSFSVVSDKSTVAAAQQDATQKIQALTDYLKGAGVDPNDIKTTGYNIYPTYEYQNASCPTPVPQIYNGSPSGSSASSGAIVYCPPGKQVLTGYEVSQTTDVKVRDTAKAGDLLSGVGQKGATEVSGLSFTVADPTALEMQARDQAIADARAQAIALAKSLGVSLGRIVSFNENRGGVPVPIYAMATDASGGTKSTAPEISTGQNEIDSTVSITYEIR